MLQCPAVDGADFTLLCSALLSPNPAARPQPGGLRALTGWGARDHDEHYLP
jgi:hypothetical protein